MLAGSHSFPLIYHAPENYRCPICLGVQGAENSDTLIRQTDIVYKDDLVTAFIGSFFVGNNPGHVIVVSNQHFEHLYELPEEDGHRVMDVARQMALGLKRVRNCDGVMILQNNEPASNQHAFHYHMHVFPRFQNDDLHANMRNSCTSTPEERKPYADALKNDLQGR